MKTDLDKKFDESYFEKLLEKLKQQQVEINNSMEERKSLLFL